MWPQPPNVLITSFMYSRSTQSSTLVWPRGLFFVFDTLLLHPRKLLPSSSSSSAILPHTFTFAGSRQLVGTCTFLKWFYRRYFLQKLVFNCLKTVTNNIILQKDYVNTYKKCARIKKEHSRHSIDQSNPKLNKIIWELFKLKFCTNFWGNFW